MYHNTPLFVVSLLFQLCQCAIERDLLLTPKEGLQFHGRTVLYESPGNKTNGITPWEQTLKHVTYLTLFPEGPETASDLSSVGEYKIFMQSPYVRIYEDYPKFGDIITMARGRLEKSSGYRFVEGTCDPNCNSSVIALWRVQKIRHRDPQRGFRYEMKFSVTPMEIAAERHLKHPLSNQYFKSFILKDDDYPESFSALTRRSDSLENFSNERQARIVNEIPRNEHPNTLLSNLPALNIGEYFQKVPKAASKVGYIQSTRPVFPTTYRPNYHVKFAKPEVFEAPKEPKTVVTHHFHHHYFMKDDGASHEQPLFLGTPDAIRIIEGPHAELLPAQYMATTSTTTTPVPPAIFYMQQIPLYIQSFPQEETTTTKDFPNIEASTKPFRQSEPQVEEIRYSDPDPLYANVNDQVGAPQSASVEIRSQVERPIGRGVREKFEKTTSEVRTRYQPTNTQVRTRYYQPTTTQVPEDKDSEGVEDQGGEQADGQERDETGNQYIDEAESQHRDKVESQVRKKAEGHDRSEAQAQETDDEETEVPFVEYEVEEVTNPPTTTTLPPPPSTRRTPPTKARKIVSSSTTENALKYASKLSLQKLRNYPRTTTEQPVLRWKPKRKPKSTQQPDTATSQSTTQETVVTVTPSKVDATDVEILTQKSVSKSISVKVGNRSEEISVATVAEP